MTIKEMKELALCAARNEAPANYSNIPGGQDRRGCRRTYRNLSVPSGWRQEHEATMFRGQQ